MSDLLTNKYSIVIKCSEELMLTIKALAWLKFDFYSASLIVYGKEINCTCLSQNVTEFNYLLLLFFFFLICVFSLFNTYLITCSSFRI